jgi:hypothetical protein
MRRARRCSPLHAASRSPAPFFDNLNFKPATRRHGDHRLIKLHRLFPFQRRFPPFSDRLLSVFHRFYRFPRSFKFELFPKNFVIPREKLAKRVFLRLSKARKSHHPRDVQV